ncbi:hypothetical protein JOQ06_024009 [Pogonophryne albipinna]|uniref:Putative monooxygenase p33MONOX n=1 Tax=Pogonophryne albipinna TaxID=1090488 RepID=A0AAD6BLB6_9TELE|nr:hypothetical protein JOQ06_024009 [Pogonophryne albipinna]
MSSQRGDIPALESGTSSGLFGAFSCPIGMNRRTVSYDDLMDATMQSPPSDFNFNIFWKDPVIPQHKFRNTAEERGSAGKLVTFEAGAPVNPQVPVVKAKATSLMSTLMIKQAQDNLHRFEHRAGLTDAGYSPHKGLSAEETRFHRLGDGTLPKLRMPTGDFKEDRCTTSAQSTPSVTPCVTPCVSPSVTPSVTPCVTPHTSPAVSRRNWFQLSPAPFLAPPELTSCETGSGFSLQSYFGMQKSSTMDSTNTQVNFKVDDPANFMPPKIEISGLDANRAPTRPHKLKPRDMNVLTPSGF